MTGGKKGVLQRWDIPAKIISGGMPGQKSSTKKARSSPNLEGQLQVRLRSTCFSRLSQEATSEMTMIACPQFVQSLQL